MREWFRFESATEFWDWVESKTRPDSSILMVAHNIHFDLTVVNGLKELHKRGWKVNFPLMKARVVIVTLAKGGYWIERTRERRGETKTTKTKKGVRRLRIIDSLNHFPMTLKELGKHVGLNKLEIDFNGTSREGLSIYCRRDVEVILAAYKQWLAFIKDNGFGKFAYTLSGQALNTFRSQYLKTWIKMHVESDALQLEYASYHGGRTECFRIGNFTGEEFFYVDVNSLYPSVMRNPVPTSLIAEIKNPTVDKVLDNMVGYQVNARVTITTDTPGVPVRYDGKLIFGTGTFKTCLPHPELKLAIERGWVTQVHEAFIYEATDIFSGYVEGLYNLRVKLREEGNETYAGFVKLLMNTLYGKFGQKNPVWTVTDKDAEFALESSTTVIVKTGEHVLERHIGNLVQVNDGEEIGHNALPIIAGTITSYARLRMLELIEKADWANVYYTDTDSLFLNAEGYRRIQSEIHPTELGKLKLEKVAENLEIRGLKDYTFGESVRIKGIPRNATWESEDRVSYHAWPSIPGLMWKGETDGYFQVPVTKTLKRQYTKGVVGVDGLVQPLRFPIPAAPPLPTEIRPAQRA